MTLNERIMAAAASKYKLGVNDCFTFAFADHQEILELAPKYKTLKDIKRLAKDHGFRDGIEGVIEKCKGFGFVATDVPRQGDIAVVETSGNRIGFGVHTAPDNAAALTKDGVEMIPSEYIRESYHVNP